MVRLLPAVTNCRRMIAAACAALLLTAFAADAQAIHPRRWAYGPAYVGSSFAGPGSVNPVGFGFGGYSYGQYPYYGYWGYAPGPYSGWSGYGPPAAGYVTYDPFAAPVVAPAPGFAPGIAPGCAVAPAAYDPGCMTPHAYRRYLRRMYRAMACCGYPCLPTVAPCGWGAAMGLEALDVGAEAEDEVIGADAANYPPGEMTVERVSPPAEATPAPSLERDF